jgi:hypothetical protein
MSRIISVAFSLNTMPAAKAAMTFSATESEDLEVEHLLVHNTQRIDAIAQRWLDRRPPRSRQAEDLHRDFWKYPNDWLPN